MINVSNPFYHIEFIVFHTLEVYEKLIKKLIKVQKS